VIRIIISHKYKFIFIKTGKTAGTSIEVYLSRYCGKDDIVTPIFPKVEGHEPRNYESLFNPFIEMLMFIEKGKIRKIRTTILQLLKRQKFKNHLSAKRIKSRIPTDIWNNYYKFCFERNPWDKTLSQYFMLRHRSNNKLTFEEYMNQEKLFPHNFHIYSDIEQENVIVDYIGKYENLNSELSNIFSKLGIPFEGSLKVKAKGNYRKDRRPYQEFYKEKYEKYIKKVEKSFEKEIRLLNYNF